MMRIKRYHVHPGNSRYESGSTVSVLLFLFFFVGATLFLPSCIKSEMTNQISPQPQEERPISSPEGSVSFSIDRFARAEEESILKGQLAASQDNPLAAAQDNPIPASKESIVIGIREYARNCEFCHGRHGRGDGPVGKKLVVPPTDLTSWSIQKRRAGGIYLAITNAPKGMPSFKRQLTDEERWDVVNFILTEFALETQAPWVAEEYKNPLELGKRIFDELRCEYCHVARRKELGSDMPPTLVYAGSKFKKDWTVSYLKRSYRVRWDIPPNIWMPSFKLSDEEREALVTYVLSRTNEERFPLNGFSEVPTSNEIARGKQFFDNHRCAGCHILHGEGARVGPDLTHVGSKLRPEYMFQFLKHPKEIIPQTSMKDFALGDEEARSLVRYLETLK